MGFAAPYVTDWWYPWTHWNILEQEGGDRTFQIWLTNRDGLVNGLNNDDFLKIF